jgi:MFS family permease
MPNRYLPFDDVSFAQAEPLAIGFSGAHARRDAFGDNVQETPTPLKRNQSPLRWLVLFFGGLIILGPYYCFDNPAGTQNALKQYFGLPVALSNNATASQRAADAEFNDNYQMLYSVYSFPNTVLPLLGGYLVDVVGVHAMVSSCILLSLAGQMVVVVGVNLQSWPLMWAGRAIFGVGTESLCVAQRILVSNWFVGRELAVANGAILALGRIGSTFNDNVSALYSAQHVLGAYCMGATICLVSVVCTLISVGIDRWFDRRHPHVGKTVANAHHGAPAIRERTAALLASVRSFNISYWVQFGIGLLGFAPVTTFNGVGVALLVSRSMQQGGDTSDASEEGKLGIMYAVAAGIAPFSGHLVDRFQHRPRFIFGSIILIAFCHLLFIFTGIPAAVMLAMMGFGFALFAATFWTNISYIVPSQAAGIAYGLMGSIQNVGLAIAPIIAARLEPPACNNSFQCVETLFTVLALVSAMLAGVLIVMEHSSANAAIAKAKVDVVLPERETLLLADHHSSIN